MRIAVVDVGTNTVRLLIADVGEGGVEPVKRAREITRLGKGVDARKRLDTLASKQTLDIIAAYVDTAKAGNAERIRIAGTSALRDAEDSMQFVYAVKERCDVELEVLTGLQEGRLSFLGATSDLPPGVYMVCDIGGGSTELTVGREGPAVSISLDVGSVRIKERFLRADPPAESQVQAVYSHIKEQLEDSNFELLVTRQEALVGTGGTITTLAAVILGLREYDPDAIHHARISSSDVSKATERLKRMRVHEVRRLAAVEAGRADVITAGALVLRFVMERWTFPEMIVSERDILDGLALDLVR
jgi:exopolyphosphatase / guanosine-5'-triphosphate,3'-diphosphate pyrophosphatase